MSGLFLDGIFNEEKCNSPSRVKLVIPKINELSQDILSSYTLYGLLASEPTISTQNKWGPIFSDISTLTEISQMMGDRSLFSWIGASVQCWKGTEPIRLSIDFYLINYKRGLRLEEGLTALTKLTSLQKVQSDSKIAESAKVMVHGGYAANVFETNKSYFENSAWVEHQNDYLKKGEQLVSGEFAPEGTVTLQIGNKVKLSNLLVARIDTTPSIAEVPTGKPLFYRVAVSFTGNRPLLSTEVDGMF